VTAAGALFAQGFVLGFSIAAPVGPIGVLCIRRTLAGGRAAGLASGLGAATADAFYGAVAGLGLTFVSAVLVREASWLRLAGGVFLVILGARAFRAPPAASAAPSRGRSLAGAYVSTLLLTLTNPMTILSFGVAFAGILARDAGAAPAHGALLVAGVFAGSVTWWLALTTAVDRLRQRLAPSHLRGVNQAAGVALAAFGLLIAAAPR
jgi:threonine/homoserine/homoserine lactone efflux protein